MYVWFVFCVGTLRLKFSSPTRTCGARSLSEPASPHRACSLRGESCLVPRDLARIDRIVEHLALGDSHPLKAHAGKLSRPALRHSSRVPPAVDSPHRQALIPSRVALSDITPDGDGSNRPDGVRFR